MIGAIIGDIVGSRFEFNNHRSKDFDLFADGCFATDDSIMTLAVAKAIMECGDDLTESRLNSSAVKWMQEIGRTHPNCGFGGMFYNWIFSDDPQPYNSFGNGAAMRVSSCGFIAETEDEARLLARSVTEVTHSHEEGIKGAEATAVAVFMAKNGATKKEIRNRIASDYYNLDFTLDEIRDTYEFNETCQETVPQAIAAFLESITFEDCIRNAVSIGGDSDTVAAIACAIAEAYYGVPNNLKRKALTYLDNELRGIVREWERKIRVGKPIRKFTYITKYINKFGDIENWQEFYQEFYIFVQQNPEYNLKDYQSVLEKHSLKWTEESMKSADVSNLNDQTVLALILGAHRAERFTDGVLETFIIGGYIDKWLSRLKTIDDERKPEPDKPLLRQVKISLEPFRDGNTSDLYLTEQQVILKSGMSDGDSATHSYNFGAMSEYGEISLAAMSDCLDADGWHDVPFFHEIEFAINLYELEAEYDDGKIVIHRGIFDRAHIPETEFTAFVYTLRDIVELFGFGGLVGLSGFMYALKKGEVKYCGVEFSDGGKVYHYRTTDLRIEEGDEVVVPVGDANYERTAIVVSVEYRRWDDTPYPLEKTKEIIRLISDEVIIHSTPELLSDGEDDEYEE